MRWTLSLVALLIAVEASPQLERQTAERAGWDALRQGDAQKAASIFRDALEVRPDEGALHMGAGIAASLLGRNDEAARALQRALELDSTLTPAALLLGQIAYSKGDLDLAIRSYEQALKSDPNRIQTKRQLEQWRKEASLQSHRSVWMFGLGSLMLELQSAPEALLAQSPRQRATESKCQPLVVGVVGA